MDSLNTKPESLEERPFPEKEQEKRKREEAILSKKTVGRVKKDPFSGAHKVFDSLHFDSVETIGQAWRYLIFKKYRHYTIWTILASVGVFAIGAIILNTEFVLVLLFLIIAGYAAYLYHIAGIWFMKMFAKANGWEYQQTAPVESVQGKLFSQGHSRKIFHVIKGVFDDHSARMFRFQYRVGSGRNTVTFNFTVFEIEFEKTEFPHILLRSRRMPKYTRPNRQEREIPLEDEFKKGFQLFSTMQYEIEVLQIFTPEFLRALRKKSAEFSIEFAGNSLYLYDNKAIKDKSGLHEIFEVAEMIFKAKSPLINRLHGHFEVMHRYYKK